MIGQGIHLLQISIFDLQHFMQICSILAWIALIMSLRVREKLKEIALFFSFFFFFLKNVSTCSLNVPLKEWQYFLSNIERTKIMKTTK